LTTKIHLLADALGRPLRFLLTGGQDCRALTLPARAGFDPTDVPPRAGRHADARAMAGRTDPGPTKATSVKSTGTIGVLPRWAMLGFFVDYRSCRLFLFCPQQTSWCGSDVDFNYAK